MYLTPWPLVAAVFNLEVAEGIRDGPFITARQAKRMATAATRKLVSALIRQGVDRAAVVAYFRLRDEGDARQHANLAALLPPPPRVHDEADPRATRSLHSVT
jgi:hypothetical protein